MRRSTRRSLWTPSLVFVIAVAGCGTASPFPSTLATPSRPSADLPRPEPTPTPEPSPAGVTIPPGNSTARAVSSLAAGSDATCVVKVDGTLACWGYLPKPPEGSFRDVAVGEYTACGIRIDGTLACWGEHLSGYDENGNELPESTPPGQFLSVSVASGYACAVRADRALICWGGNPGISPTGPVAQVAVGGSGACAVLVGGALSCWGGLEIDAPSGTFAAVSVSGTHACALRADRSVACWPSGWTDVVGPTPSGRFVAVSSGGNSSCAIRPDATLACWGTVWGPGAEEVRTPTPGGAYRVVSVGYQHACAIRTDGTIGCWAAASSAATTPLPVAFMEQVPGIATQPNVTLHWTAGELFAPTVSFDVRYERIGATGTTEPWQTWLTNTSAAQGSMKLAAGSTYCFEARARDGDGLQSDWARGGCTVSPIDDRSFSRSGHWTAVSGTRYYRATALSTTSRGAALSFRGISALALGVVVTTCPSCGAIEVLVDGTSLGRFSLISATREDRKLIGVWNDDENAVTGTLTIVVTSRGRPVIVDGLAATEQLEAFGP